MSNLKSEVYVELNQTYNTFKYLVMNEYCMEINRVLNAATPSILRRIRIATESIFYTTKTYQELMQDGELAAHFGFFYGSEASFVDPVLQEIANSIAINFKPFSVGSKGRIKGYYKIHVQPDNLKNLLSLPTARFYIGEEIKWLSWLLESGNQIIIANYEFTPDVGLKYSRSGEGIMIEGDGWGVPPQYAGTINDNWITRTLNAYSSSLIAEYEKIIEEEIKVHT